MPVNDKIREIEYNDIRAKVVGILGTGSGNSGYGQVLSSADVSVSSRVTVNEYALLRNDIVNAYKHIFGTNPTLATPVEGNTVRYNTTFTPSTTDSPITQYDTWANQIVANRFTVAGSQLITASKGSQSRNFTSPWTTRLECTITVNFTTANQARFFFNSGGEIRFGSSRSGGSANPSPGFIQNNAWTNLLSGANARFGGNFPSTGTTPADGQNYYRLNNSAFSSISPFYSISASSPYTLNVWRVKARATDTANNSTGTCKQIEFLAEWIDGYTDPTAGQPGNPPPGDQVDGLITVNVSTQEAFGTLIPVSAGNFTVESPVVSYSAISGS